MQTTTINNIWSYCCLKVSDTHLQHTYQPECTSPGLLWATKSKKSFANSRSAIQPSSHSSSKTLSPPCRNNHRPKAPKTATRPISALSFTGAATAHPQCTPTQTQTRLINRTQSSSMMQTQANATARPTAATFMATPTRALVVASDPVPQGPRDLGDLTQTSQS